MGKCPNCKSDSIFQTYVGIISGPDTNRAECSNCDWVGIVEDLIVEDVIEDNIRDVIKKTFIIRMTNGREPEKKVPIDQTRDGVVRMLQEMSKLDPNAKFLVAELTWDDDLWLHSGNRYISLSVPLEED